MEPTVTLRKAGWTAAFPHPVTGKRRQVVVESEEAGWILIKREQLQAAAEREQAIRSGAKPAPAAPAGKLSLDDAFQHSIEARWQFTKSVQKNKSLFKPAQEFFGPSTQLDAITAHWLSDFRKYRLRSVCAATVNKEVSVLRSMRTDALEHGLLEDVPTWPRNLPIKDIPPRFLTAEELQRMCDFWDGRAKEAAWNNKYSDVADLFLLRVAYGSRFHETRDLHAQDLDWRNSRLTFWVTKNGDSRTVPMIEASIEILQRRSAAGGKLFQICYQTFREAVAEARKELRLPGRVVGHVARHTMATRAVSRNISTSLLKHFGGWKSTTALQRYAHLDTSGLEHVKKALESF